MTTGLGAGKGREGCTEVSWRYGRVDVKGSHTFVQAAGPRDASSWDGAREGDMLKFCSASRAENMRAVVIRYVILNLSSHRKHVFIAAEVFIYFFLAVLDVFTHTLPTIGTSLDSFRSLDIIIGKYQ